MPQSKTYPHYTCQKDSTGLLEILPNCSKGSNLRSIIMNDAHQDLQIKPAIIHSSLEVGSPELRGAYF